MKIAIFSCGPPRTDSAYVDSRDLEIARRLSQHFDVSFGSSSEEPAPSDELDHFHWSLDNVEGTILRAQEADVLMVNGRVLSSLPWLCEIDNTLIVEIDWPSGVNDPEKETSILRRQLTHGDYFICHSERQRDWTLGALALMERFHLGSDRTPTGLFDIVNVVPSGIQERSPEPAHRNAIKGVWTGIEANDLVLLWGGELRSGADPLTVVRAMARVASQRPEVKLVLPSMSDAGDGEHQSNLQEVVELAKSSAVLAKNVLTDLRIDADRRRHYYSSADVGICAYGSSLEVLRREPTELLNCLDACLPVLCSQGNHISTLVEKRGLGKALPTGDSDAWAEAILELAGSPETIARYRERVVVGRQDFTWSKAVSPLVELCKKLQASGQRGKPGRLAPDLRVPSASENVPADALADDGFSEALKRVRTLRTEYTALEEAHVRLQQDQVRVQHDNLRVHQDNLRLQQEYVRLQQEHDALSEGVKHLQAKVDLVKRLPFARAIWRVARRFRR